MVYSTATIDNYLEDKKLGLNGSGRRGSVSTLRAYQSQLKYAEKALRKPLAEFTKDDVSTLFQRLDQEGKADRTINLVLTSCRSFFDWALHNEYQIGMKANYFRDVYSITVSQKEDIFLINEDQFHTFCNTITRQQEIRHENAEKQGNASNFKWSSTDYTLKYILALCTMFYGGLRISEALTLQKSDVKPNGLAITGKGDKDRFVPLPHWLLVDLQAFIETHQFGTFVFYGETSRSFRTGKGKPLTPGTLYKVFEEARVELGYPEDFTPHSLRHAFGTEALRKTRRLEVVQDFLGHASPSTTRIYSRLMHDDLIEEYKKIYPDVK